jgi:hypothetical protein
MGKMEGYCSTGKSPQWAAVLVEEEEEEEEEEELEAIVFLFVVFYQDLCGGLRRTANNFFYDTRSQGKGSNPWTFRI